jgi:2-polyprenyl-3-methyl-5-hydroxy-6-metoxy-1,4-benzoquinol methylase
VTTAADFTQWSRLYETYASQHAGRTDQQAAALVYRRDILPALLPVSAGPVLDIGCGQGELVRLLLADGYDAQGVDISPEQVSMARASGLDQVQEGDYRITLAERAGHLSTVIATDVLEHMSKREVLRTFDDVIQALIPGGLFVARVPNAVSPFGGHIRYGDFTHESWFTASSIRQLAAAAGYKTAAVVPCPPSVHGLPSLLRAAAWKAISGLYKVAIAAETGVIRGHIVTQNLTFAATKPALQSG